MNGMNGMDMERGLFSVFFFFAVEEGKGKNGLTLIFGVCLRGGRRRLRLYVVWLAWVAMVFCVEYCTLFRNRDGEQPPSAGGSS